MKNKVFASFENRYHDHCIDIFQRPDRRFGFEAYRRDPEDQGNWQDLARFSGQVFHSISAALTAAEHCVPWLAESEAWQRYRTQGSREV